MLGIVIGVVASAGLLTFLTKDTKAVEQNRLEQKKLEE